VRVKKSYPGRFFNKCHSLTSSKFFREVLKAGLDGAVSTLAQWKGSLPVAEGLGLDDL